MGAKGSGRKKGVPNKKTQDLQEMADELGCNPFRILLMFANDDWEGLGYPEPTTTKVTKDGTTVEIDRISPDLRAHAAKEAAKYLYPQRKAVEMSSAESGFKVILEDYVSKK